jgi:hypothetical protein
MKRGGTPRQLRAMRRIRGIIMVKPKLTTIALALVQALGPVEAARELDWISERLA